MNRAVFASLTILCLLSISSITGFIQVVKADSGTVYIRADGSIDPPTAPISSVDNVTYTFTGNINYPTYNGIVIERNNIVINGNGYTVQGDHLGNGLFWTNINNVTIKNANIKDFYEGISLYDSSNNTVSWNNATANSWNGILLNSSSSNIISWNNATANSNNGIALSDSNNNTVNGNNATANSDCGISLYDSSNNNSVSGNNATANGNCGILLYSSSNNNIVSGNIATANTYQGIFLYSSSNNIVSGNIATANIHADGIFLDYSPNNTVSGNNATANSQEGIHLIFSSNNTVIGNNATANIGDGIWLEYSSNNKIYHNNFVNNKLQVASTNSTNVWDDGYPSGGNYWSDYQTKYPNAIENDSSGIWNTPYVIDTNNTDHYPLMASYVIPEFPSFLILPLFFITILLAVIVYERSRNLKSAQQQKTN